MTVSLFVPDLMDRSKITAVVPGAVVAARLTELPGDAGDTVVVDLSRPGVLDAVAPLAARGVRVIGFASHVDRAGLEAARAAGIEVFARSAFFGRIAELLRAP
jgi:hypothetical protein